MVDLWSNNTEGGNRFPEHPGPGMEREQQEENLEYQAEEVITRKCT